MTLTPLSWKDLEWTNRIIPSRENDSKKKIVLKIIAIVSTVFLIFLVTLTIDVSKLMYAKLFGRCKPIQSPIKAEKREAKEAKKTKPKEEENKTDKKPDENLGLNPEEAQAEKKDTKGKKVEDKRETLAAQTQTSQEPIIPPLVANLKTIFNKESITETASLAIKGLKLAPEVLHENLSKEPTLYRKAVLVMVATLPFWIATKDLKWALFTSATYYGSVIGYNIAKAKLTQFTSKMKSAIPKEVQEAAEKIAADFSKVS